jgi:hypothetical protein
MKIFLDNKLADYDEIGLSFIFSNESESGSVSGSHSKRSLKLPKTKINDKILSNILDPRKQKTTKKIECRIENDGLTLLKGWAVVDSGTIDNNSYYELFIVGENSDWGLEIANKTFLDIPFGEHSFSVSQIQGAIGNDWTQGYTYILPKTGAWVQVGHVTYNEHVPAIYVRYVLEKMLFGLGYKIVGDFIQSDYFSKLVIPVLNRYYDVEFLQTKTLAKADTPTLNNVIDLDFTNETTDNLNCFNGTTYTVKLNGRYIVKALIQGQDNNGNQGNFFITVTLNGIAVNFNNTSENFELNCIVGDEIGFRLYNFNNGSIDAGEIEIKYFAHVDNVPNYEIVQTTAVVAPIFLEQLTKTWKLSDFLNDLKILFNLAISTDSSKKTVHISPKQSFTLGSGGFGGGFYNNIIKDLTQTFDVSKAIVQNFDTDSERNLSIDYIADESVSAFEKNEEIKLYSFEFDKEQGTDGTKEIKLSFFSKCLHIQDSEVQGVASIPQFPLLYDVDFYAEPNPVNKWDSAKAYLLYYEGISANTMCSLLDGNSIDNKYRYPISYMVNYMSYVTNAPTLSFSPTDSEINLLALHRRSFARIKDYTKLTIYNLWNSAELARLQFEKKYCLFETYWLLEKIDGVNPLSKTSSKTILIKDSPETDILIRGSKLKGVIYV